MLQQAIVFADGSDAEEEAEVVAESTRMLLRYLGIKERRERRKRT